MFAVFAVMEDKDLIPIIDALKGVIGVWCVGDLDVPRAAEASKVADTLERLGHLVKRSESLLDAFDIASTHATEHDRIIVFGSFFTVAAIQSHLGL